MAASLLVRDAPDPVFKTPRKSVYVACSHRWLHAKLLEQSPSLGLARNREEAELIVYLHPPWPDDEAPDRLSNFSAAELMRTFVFSQSDMPVPWAPGMYASLGRRRGLTATAFTGGFYVPHHAREAGGLAQHLEDARGLSPNLLWSFMGTVENAPLRRRLMAIRDSRAVTVDTQRFSDTLRWAWESEHRAEAQKAFREYALTLGRSRFVVCPRGRGLSSIRLFEALEMGRCPVVVADGWLPPPFVDWDSCSIRVPEDSVEKIPDILRDRESESGKLGANARLAWEHYYSPKRQLATLVDACVDISERIAPRMRPAVALRALAEESTFRTLASRRHSIAPLRALKIPQPKS